MRDLHYILDLLHDTLTRLFIPTADPIHDGQNHSLTWVGNLGPMSGMTSVLLVSSLLL